MIFSFSIRDLLSVFFYLRRLGKECQHRRGNISGVFTLRGQTLGGWNRSMGAESVYIIHNTGCADLVGLAELYKDCHFLP